MKVSKSILAALCFFLILKTAFAQNFADIKPTPQQTEWQDLEMGVLIHFGLNTFTDKEVGSGRVSPSVFNPKELDADQWVMAAKSAGAKYVIFVAKHHDGFCLWPSQMTDYSVRSSPWEGGKGDVVKEVSDASHKYGLKFGIYLSPFDAHERSYRFIAAYDYFYNSQLRELVSGYYGPILELWWDGAFSEGRPFDYKEWGGWLRTYQPKALMFADVGMIPWGDTRWVGNEDGIAPEENWDVIDLHGYLRWRPAECDTPLHKLHWFWHPNDEKSLKSVSELVNIYNLSVGRGCQLLLGLAPDDRGLLPDADVARLREFGEAIRRIYSHNLARQGTFRTDPAGGNVALAFDGNPDTFWSGPPNTHSAVLQVTFAKPVSFDRTVIMERLESGQRIEKYNIEALVGTQWRVLHIGTTIGHKKIDIFPLTTATSVRLRIIDALDSPAIREFQIFDGSEESQR